MKLFDWAHRKFQQRPSLSPFLNLHKEELLEKAVNSYDGADCKHKLVLDGWKDGVILTIGTFGFDPFKIVFDGEDYDQGEEEEEEEYSDRYGPDEEGEGAPLVLAAQQSFPEDIIYKTSVSNPETISSAEKIKRESVRRTLADLFSADSDDANIKPEEPEERLKPEIVKKPAARISKHGLSFANKFISRVKDQEKRPIQKFNQLVKRMLKRKIHPEVKGKVPKPDGLIEPSAPEFLAGDDEQHSDVSDFLLHIEREL